MGYLARSGFLGSGPDMGLVICEDPPHLGGVYENQTENRSCLGLLSKKTRPSTPLEFTGTEKGGLDSVFGWGGYPDFERDPCQETPDLARKKGWT